MTIIILNQKGQENHTSYTDIGIAPYPLDLTLNKKLFLWTGGWIQISRGKKHWQGNWFSTKTFKIKKKPCHNKWSYLRGKEKKREKKKHEKLKNKYFEKFATFL